MAKFKNKNTTVLGLMSGTSLDGLDMALCTFSENTSGCGYKILKASTVKYSSGIRKELLEAMTMSAQAYFALDARYAGYVAAKVNSFIKSCGTQPDVIASHGHTVFHQPGKGFTTQIGSGAILAAKTGITTVCDFRSLDVGLGGQGAPLVPIGDELLFGKHASCLNIGGIANISFRKNGKRLAYDICEANMLLNFLAEKLNKKFDKGGHIAANSACDSDLLRKLSSLAYYNTSGSRSLGREWFENSILPIIESSNNSTEVLLATATRHIADKIAAELNKHHINEVLITGGGAHNTFLIKCIAEKTRCRIVLPSPEVINFKEALIFAFLGYLRIRNKVNTLSTVTGAKHQSIGGAIYAGKP